MDVAQRWPFPDASAVTVNSEHLIEHLTQEGVRACLREASRVLGPQGVIRTSTPDLGGLCGAHREANPETLERHRSHGYEAATFGDLVNNYFYSWGHRHIYDFETLTLLLSEAGFEQIERASYGQSRHTALRGIDRHDPQGLESLVLIVDAVKPMSRQ